MSQTEKAKAFMSNRSHAVRIPAEDPQTGDVSLSQAQPKSWEEIFAALMRLKSPMTFWRIAGMAHPRCAKNCDPVLQNARCASNSKMVILSSGSQPSERLGGKALNYRLTSQQSRAAIQRGGNWITRSNFMQMRTRSSSLLLG